MIKSENCSGHKFKFMFKFGSVSYWECSNCNERKYEHPVDGNHPINWDWINGD